MVFLIYMILVILQCKGMTTVVPDPCPSTIVTSIVADMCKSGSASEEINAGSNKVDSVVLRIMTQQDDCICRVMIDNQQDTVVIGIRRYDGLTASAPKEAACGLAVDINHIPDMSTGIVIDPIACLMNDTLRHTPLFQKSYLQFRPRIINGNFTRGYCIRIQRDINSYHSQVLRIDCDAPMTTEQTTEKIKTSEPPQSSPQTTVSEKSTTISSNIDSTTTVTTTNVKSLVTDVKDQQITTTTDTTKGIEQTTYIEIGAGFGVALILLVVLAVICLRRKSTQKAGIDITGGKCSTADVDAATLSYKRLSMEGDYSTVDEDIRKSSSERLSVEGNYSTVDENMPKCKKKFEINSGYRV